MIASTEQPSERKAAIWSRQEVPNVKRVIMVASGKGGVGKSTVTACLALAAVKAGMRAGILDADIYGPSQPLLFGVSGEPEFDKAQLMLPKEAHGVKLMSLGFITREAAIMRGPMVSKTLYQLLRGTRWAYPDTPLDYLFIDMPPGTGDVALSLAQQTKIDGAILVTTPQEMAVMDARKAAWMFEKAEVPMRGVIENMAGIKDSSGAMLYPFGQGGGEKLAGELGVDFLGSVMLEPALMAACEQGGPTKALPDIFNGIVGKLAQ